MTESATRIILRAALAAIPFGVVAALPEPAASPVPIVVHIKDFKYDPQTLEIHVDDTVTFINDDEVAHTVTAVDKSFDSGSIDTSHTWKHVFTKTGASSYFCSVHPFMKARFIVRPTGDAKP